MSGTWASAVSAALRGDTTLYSGRLLRSTHLPAALEGATRTESGLWLIQRLRLAF